MIKNEIKMKDRDEAQKCFYEHDVEEVRYEHHFNDVNVEYKCNTCDKVINMSYKLDVVSISKGE